MKPLIVLPGCICPELEGFDEHNPAHLEGCPRYTDCGGQGSDPPCGGCDRCIWDRVAYCKMRAKMSGQQNIQ